MRLERFLADCFGRLGSHMWRASTGEAEAGTNNSGKYCTAGSAEKRGADMTEKTSGQNTHETMFDCLVFSAAETVEQYAGNDETHVPPTDTSDCRVIPEIDCIQC